MKCYRLNATAWTTLKNSFEGMSFVIILLMFLFGMVAYPLVLVGVEDSIIMAGLGVLNWTALLSIIVISFKRWIIDNLEEC